MLEATQEWFVPPIEEAWKRDLTLFLCGADVSYSNPSIEQLFQPQKESNDSLSWLI